MNAKPNPKLVKNESEADRLEIKKLYAEATEIDSTASRNAETALEKYTRIGEILAKRKSKCLHGEWLPWLKENIEFSDQAARNYMSLYVNRKRLKKLKFKSVLNLTDAYLLGAEDPEEVKSLTEEATRTGNSVGTISLFRKTAKKLEPEVLKAVKEKTITQSAARSLSQLPKTAQVSALRNMQTGPSAETRLHVKDVKEEEPVEPRTYEDASELEAQDRSAFVKGSTTEKDRRKYYRWEAYRSRKIRDQVLTVFTSLKTIDVRQHPAFSFGYDVDNPDDLNELRTMLDADLSSVVSAKKLVIRQAARKAKVRAEARAAKNGKHETVAA